MNESPSVNKNQSGVVTFLDVLGWKGVYDRQTNAVASLKRLVEGVGKKAEQQRGRLSGSNADVNVKSISDTIAIFTFCGDDEVSKAIEIHGELCQWLIPESIKSELPMRGATSYGEFEISDNIFVGKAVDEAASWHEQGNWIGVNLSPSAEFAFLAVGKNSVWIPYPAPIKVPMKWQPHCVNWIADWRLPETKRRSICSSFQKMGPILPEIAPKFINTLAFIDEMRKNLTLGDQKVVLIVEGQTDAKIVDVVTTQLGLRRSLVVEVAYGKQRLRENLKEYASAFKNSAGIIVLADADTSDEGEIETQKAQFQQIVADSERPDIRVILAVPEIEAWLGRTDFKRDRTHSFNKLFEELYHLQEGLEARALSVPSLAEFITALKHLDNQI